MIAVCFFVYVRKRLLSMEHTFIFEHIFSILYWLNAVVAIGITVSVVLDNRNPVATFAWIFVLLFIPYLGLLLYFFFGRDTRRRRYIRRRLRERIGQKKIFSPVSSRQSLPPGYANIITYLEKSSNAYLATGCSAEPIFDCEQFARQLLQAIAAARSHVHIQFYIFEDDGFGNAVMEALVAKAAEGVEVRLIYDGVGCFSVKSSFFNRLRAAGGCVAPFLKVHFPLLTNKVNYRNHRKLVVVDGSLAFIGGCNIADRYLHGINGGEWRDTMLAVRGKGVYGIQSSFLLDWYFASGRVLCGPDYFPEQEAAGSVSMQVMTSNPVGEWRTIPGALVAALMNAREYVYLQTPYLMPSESVLAAMQNAALAGVDVRLMIPARSDSALADYASYSYLGALIRAGVKVYLYEKGFLHAKTLVSDGVLSVVGSANLDFRSFSYNFEICAYMYDGQLAESMHRQFMHDVSCSHLLTLREYESRGVCRRLLESGARLFSPIL